jgi:hypothetical protein
LEESNSRKLFKFIDLRVEHQSSFLQWKSPCSTFVTFSNVSSVPEVGATESLAEDAKWKMFSALSEKVIMARGKMEELQRLVQQDPGSTDLLASESCAVKYYSKMRRAKEAF